MAQSPSFRRTQLRRFAGVEPALFAVTLHKAGRTWTVERESLTLELAVADVLRDAPFTSRAIAAERVRLVA